MFVNRYVTGYFVNQEPVFVLKQKSACDQIEEEVSVSVSCHLINCLCRERGQPYLLYIALAHMHVPLAPPLPPDASATARRPGDGKVYAASLREMDGLVGAVKSASDDTDKDNTLIWFTG